MMGVTNALREINLSSFQCYYRPQRKFAKVMFLQVCVCPQGVCGRGMCKDGGLHGRGGGHAMQGVCMVGGMHGGGHAWQGACVAGGMHGRGACMAGGHAWQGHEWHWVTHGKGACMVGGIYGWGMHGRGHAWQRGVCGRGACITGGIYGRGMHGRGHAYHACPPSRYYGHGIRSMSGRYTSYWNAFLFQNETYIKSIWDLLQPPLVQR